jgi:DNA modification methylase
MSTCQILLGDCRQTLAQLATGSVQTCISSPPYWNLRDYDVAGQIGLEAVPDCLAWARQEPPCGGCFVCEMRSVYGAELRRVLADDGTVWVNLGDSYASNGKNRSKQQSTAKSGLGGGLATQAQSLKQASKKLGNLKNKNLIGIPWRVALALQADGWILRQDIIWHKPNPMPESVGDRCTKAHEYIFLLSKKPKYFFNHKAIQETALGQPGTTGVGWNKTAADSPNDTRGMTRGRVVNRKSFRGGGAYTKGQSFDNSAPAENETHGNQENESGTRNRRSVWTVATQPYPGAHFATFPPELIRPCVQAGSRVGDTVLDLFGGSGTTAQVAVEEGRTAVLCELNPKYLPLIHKRMRKVQTRLQFGQPVAATP